jgi:ABC-type Zn2+ transport system substrate-binding protein/surface adhesin
MREALIGVLVAAGVGLFATTNVSAAPVVNGAPIGQVTSTSLPIQLVEDRDHRREESRERRHRREESREGEHRREEGREHEHRREESREHEHRREESRERR